jgi:coenzyme F420-reducing hydrogenase gamma subunit
MHSCNSLSTNGVLNLELGNQNHSTSQQVYVYLQDANRSCMHKMEGYIYLQVQELVVAPALSRNGCTEEHWCPTNHHTGGLAVKLQWLVLKQAIYCMGPLVGQLRCPSDSLGASTDLSKVVVQ